MYLYTYICIYIRTYMCIYMFTYIRIHIYILTFICIYILYTYMRLCVYIWNDGASTMHTKHVNNAAQHIYVYM